MTPNVGHFDQDKFLPVYKLATQQNADSDFKGPYVASSF